MKILKNLLVVSIVVVAVSISMAILQQVAAHYRETEYISGSIRVNEGDAYGPYPYATNAYYTTFMDSVSPELGLYVGYINSASGTGNAYYRYPGGYVNLPHDGTNYYVVYINTYPNDESVTYTGRIITTIE